MGGAETRGASEGVAVASRNMFSEKEGGREGEGEKGKRLIAKKGGERWREERYDRNNK